MFDILYSLLLILLIRSLIQVIHYVIHLHPSKIQLIISHFPFTPIKQQKLNPLSTYLYLEFKVFCMLQFYTLIFHTLSHNKRTKRPII